MNYNGITVGVDAGNNEVKVASAYGLDKFSSAIGEYRERNMVNEHGKDDLIVEYQGVKKFAGTLAQAESEFVGSMMGDTKAHEDAKLRILIALHRIETTGLMNNFNVIVGQPIGKHDEESKRSIKEMLRGIHEVTVNGRYKTINITNVEVAAEGGAAFWSSPTDGLVRIIDLGSGTVNCASLTSGRYVDRDSFTLPFGCNTVKSRDFKSMARAIITETSKKWKKDDFVLVAGGATGEIVTHLSEYYNDIAELSPVFNGKQQSPVFANAIGFYQLGRVLYEER